MKFIIIMLILGSGIIDKSVKDNRTYMIADYIKTASDAFNIDPALLYAVCSVESHCKESALNRNDGKRAKRELGIKDHSHGLFQIKMATARALGFKGTKQDLMRPSMNTWYAAKLLRNLYDKYEVTSYVISAYNAGRPIQSNTEYVSKILTTYAVYKLDKKL